MLAGHKCHVYFNFVVVGAYWFVNMFRFAIRYNLEVLFGDYLLN